MSGVPYGMRWWMGWVIGLVVLHGCGGKVADQDADTKSTPRPAPSATSGAAIDPTPTGGVFRSPTPTVTSVASATAVATTTPNAPQLIVDSVTTLGLAPVRVGVSLDSAGSVVAGTQNDLSYDSSLAGVAVGDDGKPYCAVNPTLNKGASAFSFQPPGCRGNECTGVRAILVAFDNVDPIPDGSVLYVCYFEVRRPGPVSIPIHIGHTVASQPDGQRLLDVSGVDGTITVSDVTPTALR